MYYNIIAFLNAADKNENEEREALKRSCLLV